MAAKVIRDFHQMLTVVEFCWIGPRPGCDKNRWWNRWWQIVMSGPVERKSDEGMKYAVQNNWCWQPIIEIMIKHKIQWRGHEIYAPHISQIIQNNKGNLFRWTTHFCWISRSQWWLNSHFQLSLLHISNIERDYNPLTLFDLIIEMHSQNIASFAPLPSAPLP